MIKTFIALFSSTPVQLGLDPAVTLVPGSTGQYIYRIAGRDGEKDRFFKTTAIVVETRSLQMTGKNTRVWKVIETNELGTNLPGALEAILKDIWVDEDSETEDEIQARLFEDIERLGSGDGESWRAHPCLAKFKESERDALGTLLKDGKYKEYFLCVSDHHKGEPSKPVMESAWVDMDTLKKRPRFDKTAQSGLFFEPSVQRKTGPHQSEAPSAPVAPELQGLLEQAAPWRDFSPKRRCFFLFTEVCKRVTRLPTLGAALRVLEQAHTGTLASLLHRSQALR